MVKGSWIHSLPRFIRSTEKGGQEKPSSLAHGVGGVHHQIPAPALDERPRADKMKKQSDENWRTDNNGPLQDIPISSGNPPNAPPQDRVYRLCDGCHGDIACGNYLGCMGKYYHPDCFRCFSCGYPITEKEFSYSGYNQYHKSCFKELNHPKCDVCYQFIPLNNSGLIEYRCHPYWSQKYCPSHEHDNTARCCSCERFESWKKRHVLLRDGRSLCAECRESAIMDTGDCLALYHAVRDFFEGLFMKLDQQIPLLLVDTQALDEEYEKNGPNLVPSTRGLCFSERSRNGGNRLSGVKKGSPKILTQETEVTAILVLSGLPRLLTGSILANLLMRAWLCLNGCGNLKKEVEEGICNMLSYMWLESEVLPSKGMPSTSTASSSSSSSKKGGRSNVENKLGEFFRHQIPNDTSPASWRGFRAANAAVNKYGLRRTLVHIRLTGDFPL